MVVNLSALLSKFEKIAHVKPGRLESEFADRRAKRVGLGLRRVLCVLRAHELRGKELLSQYGPRFAPGCQILIRGSRRGR